MAAALLLAWTLGPEGRDEVAPEQPSAPPAAAPLLSPRQPALAVAPAPAPLADSPDAASPADAGARRTGLVRLSESAEPWFGFCESAPDQLAEFRAGFLTRRALHRRLAESWPQLTSLPIDQAIAQVERSREDPGERDLRDLQLARLLATTTRLDQARVVLADYLRRDPDDVDMAQYAARLGTQLEIQAGYRTIVLRGITVWYDRGALDDQHAFQVAETVRQALDEAAALTRTRARETLTVVVYPSRSELLAVSCVPDWSAGIFDGSMRVVAKNGAVSARTLRHEGMHAQVSHLMVNEPRWFGEGLAEYFERPHARYDAASARPLVKAGTVLPFGSASEPFRGSDAHLATRAYLQSDAMVRWLVAVRGTDVLGDAVEYFVRARNPGALLTSLDPSGALNEDAFGLWLTDQAK